MMDNLNRRAKWRERFDGACVAVSDNEIDHNSESGMILLLKMRIENKKRVDDAPL